VLERGREWSRGSKAGTTEKEVEVEEDHGAIG